MDTTLLTSQKVKLVAGLIGLYLVTVGISYAAFSFLVPGTKVLSPQDVARSRGKLDLSGPKDQECPLTGEKYTKGERDIWETRRPLGIMIENHEEARPQSGLSRADIVYEAIAEGGITRFLAIFYCGASAGEVTVGPVRSARTYYVDWISEYGNDPLYVHVGGANKPGPADALGQMRKYGWEQYNDLNQFSIGFPTFRRDYERLGHPVATEHTMYSTTDKLWEVAAKRGLTHKNKNGRGWDDGFVPWKFAAGRQVPNPDAANVKFGFWTGYSQYSVSWVYDSGINQYRRENGGQAHTDLNNEEQIMAANVIVMLTGLRGPVDELKHMLYTTSGSGKVLVFQNGTVIVGKWEKKDRTARTKFVDRKGEEISLVGGRVWVEVLENGTEVEY